ncbi:MAG: adenylosuccinate lyase [Candidatus Levybacteria bacterium]|nr:adenylosuccinate lyase [Candidatus Levybacteria bacterium]
MARRDNRYLPLEELTALTPLDGRYRSQLAQLATYLSEYSLIRVRIEVEAKFLSALTSHGVIRSFTPAEKKLLESLGPETTLADERKVKHIEERTKHDVKAVEIYLREKLSTTSLKDVVEMIHFGLTSEDVNNLSYRLMLKRALENVILPSLETLLTTLVSLSEEYKATPMLARTHGQAAIPTTLGKELVVFAYRLAKEISRLRSLQFSGKLAGAVGNYNALSVAYEKVNWPEFAKTFLKDLDFSQSLATTQTNMYEDIISFFQIFQRINNILIDFDQDMWRYISDGWFVQEVKREEIGSSTMPQKVNPIRFENSEGNLGMGNAMIEFFVRKLPISRLQRDLSDSTVIRNFGSALGYSLLAYQATLDGLTRVKPNLQKIEEDLLEDWSILAEAAQTILRKNGVNDPYSLLKGLTRGEKITKARWKEIIQTLHIEEGTKKSLLSLSPKKYIGLAPEIVEQTLEEIEKSRVTPKV